MKTIKKIAQRKRDEAETALIMSWVDRLEVLEHALNTHLKEHKEQDGLFTCSMCNKQSFGVINGLCEICNIKKVLIDGTTEPKQECKQCQNPYLKGIHTCGLDAHTNTKEEACDNTNLKEKIIEVIWYETKFISRETAEKVTDKLLALLVK